MIHIKDDVAIEKMRYTGHCLAKIMDILEECIKPGIRTRKLEKYALGLIKGLDATPAFKGYQGYPTALCVSINEELVHGVPSWRKIKKGDVVSIDCGIIIDGYYADMARTIAVGEVDPEVARLIKVTKDTLSMATKEVDRGVSLGSLGNSIDSSIKRGGFSNVIAMAGHGIGLNLHEEPMILNYGKPGTGVRLEPGMTFCIEPMASMGSPDIEAKGFCHKMKDNSICAHFEHTVLVTEEGCEILTI